MDPELEAVLHTQINLFAANTFLLALLVFGLGLLILGVIAYGKHRYVKRLRNSGIFEVDKMTGWEFEKFLEGLFLRQGYKVTHVGSSGGDFGGDLVLEKDGERTLVQAKRSASNVGIKAIQEVVGGKRKYNCHRVMVVTNSYLTPAAWELGRVNGVNMVTRKRLIEEMLATKN